MLTLLVLFLLVGGIPTSNFTFLCNFTLYRIIYRIIYRIELYIGLDDDISPVLGAVLPPGAFSVNKNCVLGSNSPSRGSFC